MIGATVAEQARQWRDVPFHWGQATRAGCDCKGFIAGVARQARDPALAQAALGACDVAAVPQLTAMIADRMRRTGSGPV